MSRAIRKIAFTTQFMVLALALSPLAPATSPINLRPTYLLHLRTRATGCWKRQSQEIKTRSWQFSVRNRKTSSLSGDAVQDKTTVDAFVAAYGQMHRWRKMPDEAQILLIGADNFAVPDPAEEKCRRTVVLRRGCGKR